MFCGQYGISTNLAFKVHQALGSGAVSQIQENPYLQYFCGYKAFDDSKPPFDPSMMVYFRKRLTPEIIGEINEMIISAEQAKLEKEKEMLDSKGIIHGIRSQNHLDEAASAYKNIDEVMANQQDLVKIITRLSPIAVVKG